MKKSLIVAALGVIPLAGAVLALPAHADPVIETSVTDIVAAPQVVNADHPDTVITGVAHYKDADGTLHPLAGKEVDLVGPHNTEPTYDVRMKAVTAADGSFSFAYRATGTDSRGMFVRVPKQGDYQASIGGKEPQFLLYEALPSRVAADSDVRLSGDGSATVTGNGEVQAADGTWSPADGLKIDVWIPCVGAVSHVGGCPDALLGSGTVQNGKFSVAISAKGWEKLFDKGPYIGVFVGMYEKEALGYFYQRQRTPQAGVRYEVARGSFKLLPALPSTPAPTPTPTQTSTPAPSPTQTSTPPPSQPTDGNPGKPTALTLRVPTRAVKNGTVKLTGSLTGPTCGACQVQLYFQPEGKRTWKRVVTATTYADGDYQATVKATGDGRYQAKAEGLASTIKKVDVGLKTAIKAKVTPRHPRKGAKFTVSGTLSSYDGKWRRLARHQVCLLTTTGKKLACTKTDKRGAWRITLKTRKDLTILAASTPSDTYLPISGGLRIDVR